MTEELLSSVGAAREALDKADGEYNAALDRLEVGVALKNSWWQAMMWFLLAGAGRSPSSIMLLTIQTSRPASRG